jgi:hypothetical protein
MIRFFVVFLILALSPAVSTAKTEYILTKQEFVQWKQAEKKVMDIILTDYSNALSPKQRSHLTAEHHQWTARAVNRCAKEKDFESRQQCLAVTYHERAKDLNNRLAAELKNQNVDFKYPKFPINLSGGDFQMNVVEDGKYSFSFLIHGANGHECGGNGIAIWNGDSFSRVPDSIEKLHEDLPGATEADMPEIERLNKSCILSITFSPHFVALSSNGNYDCHQHFMCGMRISADGEFLRNDFRVIQKAAPNKHMQRIGHKAASR